MTTKTFLKTVFALPLDGVVRNQIEVSVQGTGQAFGITPPVIWESILRRDTVTSCAMTLPISAQLLLP